MYLIYIDKILYTDTEVLKLKERSLQSLIIIILLYDYYFPLSIFLSMNKSIFNVFFLFIYLSRHTSIFLSEDDDENENENDDEMPDLPDTIESFQVLVIGSSGGWYPLFL